MTATIERTYTPRGASRKVFHLQDSEVLVSGPAGTGKSRGCLEKLYMMALLNPGMRGLIVRKTATSLGSTALVTWREHVAKEGLANGIVNFYGGSAQEPPQYRFTNGSRIVIGGMDKATRIMSSEYDVIYVQEAIELTEDDWEALTTRLRHGKVSFQQIIADTNPSTPTHWLNERCNSGKTIRLESVHEENPVLFDEAGNITPEGASYMAKLDNLSGPRYLRLRKGLWVAAEGIVYEEWNPAVHLVNRFHIPWDWPRYWVVDFGYVHPFVLQRWAEDSDGRLYLYAETYRTKRIVEDHAKEVLSRVKDGEWIEPRPRAVICDHDAEDRATLERHLGMSTVAATKTVSDGIQAVQSRLRVQGDGKPRLFVLRDSVIHRDPELVDAKRPASTEEEFPGYVWDGKGKDQPVKEFDDGMDCVRYMVAHRDLGKRVGLRFFGEAAA